MKTRPRSPKWKMELITRKMSLEQLALETGFSISLLSRLGNGWKEPSERVKEAVAKAMEMDTEKAWRKV